MNFVVRQTDGNEMVVAAERLCVEEADNAMYRFHGPDGAFLALPVQQVEHVRIDSKGTFPHDKGPLVPRPPMRSG